jgi:rhodanese-related sulfurtransferase
MQAVIIVVLGAGLGVAANVVAPWRIDWIAEKPTLRAAGDSQLIESLITPAEQAREPESEHAVVEPLSVTLEQAKRLWDDNAALFIDTRPPYEMPRGTIPGARNIPYDEIDYYRDVIAALPRDSIYVIYCDAASCDLSIHLGEEFAKAGFTRVRVFSGGWDEWVDAGYPVEIPQ